MCSGTMTTFQTLYSFKKVIGNRKAHRQVRQDQFRKGCVVDMRK